jgi:sugar phosphate isomerase/epimerase
MKLSYVVSTHPTRFRAVSAGNWKRKAETLARLGYDGIELAIRDPRRIDVKKLEKLLSVTGLELSAIGTGQAYLEDGLSLGSCVSGISKRAMDRIKRQIDLASPFRSRVIIGLIRGGGKTGEKFSRRNLVKSLKETCRHAKKMGVSLVVEPINRYETLLVNNISEALALIKEVRSDMFFAMLDTFHMNIEERSFTDAIKKARRKLAYFHVADSDRWYPGHGHIDFARMVRDLRDIGYDGYISGEVLPLPSFNRAAAETLRLFKKIMKKGSKR